MTYCIEKLPSKTQTDHSVYFEDSRNLSHTDDKSVELIVTSPPYWAIKDYGVDNQIGFGQTEAEYIHSLNKVWRECDRVLKDGCRICINVGDVFYRANKQSKYEVIPISTHIIETIRDELGYLYMGDIIWRKITNTHTTGGASVMGSYPHPRNGCVSIDYEHILLFKKSGTPPSVSAEAKADSQMTKEEWRECFSSIWNIPGERHTKHPASYPIEIPSRLIKMFSFEGETVLDPFVGSGTTSLAAMLQGRNSIGYDIQTDYESVIRERFLEACNESNNAI